MADISQVKLPNGDTYNLVDETSGYSKVHYVNITESNEVYTADATYAQISSWINAGDLVVFVYLNQNYYYDHSLNSYYYFNNSMGPWFYMGASEIGYTNEYYATGNLEEYVSIYGGTVGNGQYIIDNGYNDETPIHVGFWDGHFIGLEAGYNSVRLSGLATPVADSEAANKKYVDDSIPNVPSWALQSSKPSYLLSEISGTDDLQSIEGLSGTSGLLKKTAANTWTLDTNTYLTSYTETDPVFSASAAAGITSTDISNWNGKTSNIGTITSVKTTAGAHTVIDVTSGAASFNVPTKTSHLTNDSGFLTSHQTLYEEKIEWGPTSISKVGSVSPIGMALSSEHSSNRLAFINGDALTFEYSSDGGSTYTNYNYAKADKTAFCTTSYGVPIGRISGNYTTSSRTRVTLTAQNGTTGYVYTNPKKLLINISSSGGMQVLIEYRTGTNYQNNGSWSTFGTYNLSGWSGWNDIPLILGTLGGGTNQTGNNWQLRLTFIMTSVNSSYPTTAHVNSIRLFGENGWQTTSNLGNTGHLYSYDVNQNAYFPAQITATQFNGNVTGTATGNLTSVQYDSTNAKLTYTKNGSNTDIVTVATLKSALGSMPASDVYSWAKASTKPTYTASEVGALASNTTYVSTITTTAGTHSAISSKSGAVSFNVPTKTSHLTNDSGYLTGITSSQVTTALGYTPYNSTNPNGYTSNTGTVTKVTAGTGLSIGTTAGGNFTTSGTINHTNSVTAQTTQAVYPIKIDAQGHISAYGSAVTIPGVTKTTATLSTTWSSKQQSVTVSGVTTSNTVIVTPAPASYNMYCECGVYCSAQAANSLTFTCDEVPTSSLTVNIVILS